MKKVLLGLSSLFFSFFLCGISQTYAQEEVSSNTTGATNWKQELVSDKQQIKDQRQAMQQNAQSARAGEEQLRQQIKDAVVAGDTATVSQLREQLRALHQQNLQQKQQDMQSISNYKNELKSDVSGARQEAYTSAAASNSSGSASALNASSMVENNPPGPRGGPGTGPARNNPPGPKGGQGTNWGNPPGPRGGAGASPAKSGTPVSRPSGGGRSGGGAKNTPK